MIKESINKQKMTFREGSELSGGGGHDYSISILRLVALLMIVICHIMQYYGMELAWWFNVGVQIFLCISGYLYGQKNINNVVDFYKDRCRKILVPYYLVYIPFGIIEFWFSRDSFSFQNYIKGFILNSTISGAGHLWFVPTILVCYFITPLLCMYRERYVKDFKSLCNYLICAVILISIYFGCFDGFFNPAWISCYVVGYCLGLNEKNKYIEVKSILNPIGIITFISNIIEIILSYLLNYKFRGFSYFQNFNHVLLGVFLFLLIKNILNQHNISKCKRITQISDYYSYEIYLVHQLVILGPFSLLSLTSNTYLNFLLVGICIFILAYFLKVIEKMILSKQ